MLSGGSQSQGTGVTTHMQGSVLLLYSQRLASSAGERYVLPPMPSIGFQLEQVNRNSLQPHRSHRCYSPGAPPPPCTAAQGEPPANFSPLLCHGALAPSDPVLHVLCRLPSTEPSQRNTFYILGHLEDALDFAEYNNSTGEAQPFS